MNPSQRTARATAVLTMMLVLAFSLGRWTRPVAVVAAEERAHEEEPAAAALAGRASPASAPSAPAPAQAAPKKLLTKHVDESYENQTIYVSGQAFIRCKFKACTLVFRESTYHLEKCVFDRCNFHIDWLVLWGDTDAIAEFKALADMLDTAYREGHPTEAQTPQSK